MTALVVVVWSAVGVTAAGAVVEPATVVEGSWEVVGPMGTRAAQPASSRASTRSAALTAKAGDRGLIGARAALGATPRLRVPGIGLGTIRALLW